MFYGYLINLKNKAFIEYIYISVRSIFFFRDLKTTNVFLTKKRQIKLGDFGISKIMTTKLQALTVVGTPYYISPEMVSTYIVSNKCPF